MKSKVYFGDYQNLKENESRLSVLKKVCLAAGLDKIDMDGKFVAIKMHFGELGNLAFLRPNYVKVIADIVKEKGGRPFITDCNTLYPGSRKNAIDHLNCAEQNGFNTVTTGCQVIIADGLRGTDEELVPVKNGEYVKEAMIGRALMDADIIISLTHFKGHESTGFGGCLKNLGMGGGSRAGKMDQHNHGKPTINEEKCRGCRRCAKSCGSDALYYENNKAHVNLDLCKGCGRCIGACSFDAIRFRESNSNEILCYKIAEYTQAIVQDRPQFHISLVQEVSPLCDCYGGNGLAIFPDIGIFASLDPVAIDQACADACLKEAPLPKSVLDKNCQHHHGGNEDYFEIANPNTHWQDALKHGEKIGLGSRDYEIIEVK